MASVVFGTCKCVESVFLEQLVLLAHLSRRLMGELIVYQPL